MRMERKIAEKSRIWGSSVDRQKEKNNKTGRKKKVERPNRNGPVEREGIK
jgi:hypothetical protein